MVHFKASNAREIVEQAIQGDFISKGKVIDIIKNSARKGESSVTIKGLPESIKESLITEHEFVITGDLISW